MQATKTEKGKRKVAIRSTSDGDEICHLAGEKRGIDIAIHYTNRDAENNQFFVLSLSGKSALESRKRVYVSQHMSQLIKQMAATIRQCLNTIDVIAGKFFF